MKRGQLLLVLLTVFLLAGCTTAEVLTPTVATFRTEPVKTTEATLPEMAWISQEQAMLEGYVVMQYGDVRHNQKAWMDFLENCDRGENASVRMVRYWDDGSQTVYDVSYDGDEYTMTIQSGGQRTALTFSDYLWESGKLGEEQEPYDSYLRCSLTDEENVILYEDLIAQPDYTGVTEINLHLKQGEPAMKTFRGEACTGLVEFLRAAEYMTCPPEEYLLGIKLIMTNGAGQELILEMDLQQGLFRYGEQYYRYGEASADLLAALGLLDWPEEVKAEYGI